MIGSQCLDRQKLSGKAVSALAASCFSFTCFPVKRHHQSMHQQCKWQPKWTRPASSLIHYQQTASLYPASIRWPAVRSTCFHFGNFAQCPALVNTPSALSDQKQAIISTCSSSALSQKPNHFFSQLKRRAYSKKESHVVCSGLR